MLSKWLSRLLIVFVAVFLIDFNCTYMRPSPEKGPHVLLINFVLGGALLILFISQLVKRRL